MTWKNENSCRILTAQTPVKEVKKMHSQAAAAAASHELEFLKTLKKVLG